MQPEGKRADADNLRVLPAEAGHKRLCKNDSRRRNDDEEDRRILHTKSECLPHPSKLLCPVIHAADRLEALSETDQRRVGKHGNSSDNGHCRDRRVTVDSAKGSRRMIQTDLRNAGKPLSAKGRHTAPEDLLIQRPCGFEIAKFYTDISALSAHQKEEDKADNLADNRGKRRSRNSHIAGKDQQRVENHIQQSARHNSHHRIGCAALKTKLIIQHQR